ncbi:MAG TPA: hypothetical protein PK186_08945 [candidate division Zixibacteria bacterium]|nr:hypothetical protein [candidate division Zixibacteria bacterium]MDD4916362.1 hypothetical protein [candidate division Zixibacteria bacterium]MDM7972822.1 hypothetical protein [candidate division Zixibacteria bacterium]HOD66598.1 hypothetical protein [candidate division Zixibacteria bacterium]HPM37667.1 hypothetical protein [candidate division Zixibacteria bacterium]
MKHALAILIGLLLCLAVSAPLAQEDAKPWFDLEKCAFCKQLLSEEGLIDHMHPAYHNLKSGVLWITVVDPEYRDAFKRAGAKMEEVGAEMQKTGEVPYMCGFCSAYGELMMAGAVPECVETEVAEICLMQSDKPELVERLHAFAARSSEEMAKLKAAESAE